jgi:hypothetical protein
MGGLVRQMLGHLRKATGNLRLPTLASYLRRYIQRRFPLIRVIPACGQAAHSTIDILAG